MITGMTLSIFNKNHINALKFYKTADPCSTTTIPVHAVEVPSDLLNTRLRYILQYYKARPSIFEIYAIDAYYANIKLINNNKRIVYYILFKMILD